MEIEGTDQDVRPYFVALQGVIEHVLSCELQNEIRSLLGIIHTPMPATPLCSQGEVSRDLLDSVIEILRPVRTLKRSCMALTLSALRSRDAAYHRFRRPYEGNTRTIYSGRY